MAKVEQDARHIETCALAFDRLLQHDAGQHLFFPHFVGHGQHRHLRHQRMRLQQRLHLSGSDVLTRATDDVLTAVYKVQHAGIVALHDVPGMEPATAPGVFGGSGIVQVAREKILARRGFRVTDDQLTGRAVGLLLACLVDHPGLDARYRTAEGASADLARRHVVDQHAHHLGHAPELKQRKAEARLEDAVQLRLHAGAEAEAHAVIQVTRSGRLVQQHRYHDAQVVHHGGA